MVQFFTHNSLQSFPIIAGIPPGGLHCATGQYSEAMNFMSKKKKKKTRLQTGNYTVCLGRIINSDLDYKNKFYFPMVER